MHDILTDIPILVPLLLPGALKLIAFATAATALKLMTPQLKQILTTSHKRYTKYFVANIHILKFALISYQI